MNPEVDTTSTEDVSSRTYEDRRRGQHYHQRAEDSLNGSGRHRKMPIWLVLVTSFLTGGGSALTIPVIWPALAPKSPDLIEQDNAQDRRLELIEGSLAKLTLVIESLSKDRHEFLIKGPDEVRKGIEENNEILQSILQLVIRHDERAKLEQEMSIEHHRQSHGSSDK